ncbi:hypothetical protein C9I43_16440 [Shewanella morhuae]|uniref:Type I restriction modification DNA specificity domain-containing protein n=1 Tax=Shewanella morhuae TaxID=365591 RepID=A0ABX5HP62_9GAMM|nr:restriction endonuclease subunit S [Shewanella morhuae]PTA48663.1 hypothetical protein C9I43_16440 [Shewanella morhuae]
MNKSAEKGLVPELRFPEFQSDGYWCFNELGSKTNKVGSGITPKGGDKNYKSAGVPFVRSQNIGWGDLILENIAFIEEEVHQSFLGTVIKENDVLLNITGASIGRTAIADQRVASGNVNQHVCIIRTKLKELNPVYLCQFILSPNGQQQIDSFQAGGNREGLNFAQIRSFSIPIPPNVEEQQKIADCLSSLDELLSAHNQKLDTLKAHKTGLMQQLFPAEGETVPRLRFPAFRDQSEWVEFKLIDLVDKNVKWSFIGGPFGSNLKSSDYVEKGIRIIQLQNIGDAQFNDTYQIFTSKEKADELLANNIYPGDIIISKMGDPVGRACLIPETHHRYVMCSDGIRLVVNEELHNKYFIYSLINDIKFRSSIERSATGSTRKRIGLDDLKKLTMLVPKLDEQQKIANLFFPVDALIAAQIQKIESLKTHKKGLMQQLFPSIDGDKMDAKAEVGA